MSPENNRSMKGWRLLPTPATRPLPVTLAPEDFILIETKSGIKLGEVERYTIGLEIALLVPCSPWDDRKYLKKRREAKKSIISYLTKIEKLIVDTLMVDDCDDSKHDLPEIRKMRAFYVDEVKRSRRIGRPKNARLRDVLMDLLQIYRGAGGTHWRVRKTLEGDRKSKFIDFVLTIFDCAKIPYPGYEGLCAFWEKTYRHEGLRRKKSARQELKKKDLLSINQ
jgi:hypothetical protein